MGRCQGDEVLVEGDGLMQPLPGLVQGIQTDPKTKTIFSSTQHSSLCCQDEETKTLKILKTNQSVNTPIEMLSVTQNKAKQFRKARLCRSVV
jgi:hypothetical protein